MILVDANLLFYAEDAHSPHHHKARTWWDRTLSGREPVGLAWITLCAYIRVFTNPRVVERPLTVAEAIAAVDGWLHQPVTQLVAPADRFWDIYKRLLTEGQATANLSSDAYLAALAVEQNAVLHTTDADFARFPGLRWRNPLT